MREARRELPASTLVVAASIGVLALVMQLWRADWHVPFYYSQYVCDFIPQGLIVKTVMDNGWSFHNRFLAAPFGFSPLEYPFWDNLHLFLVWLLSRFRPDLPLVMNLYFVAGFPLTALAAYLSLRSLAIGRWAAGVGGLLYAFLPFHLERGEEHFFLTSYFLVPLVCLVALWLAMGEPLFRPRLSRRGKGSLLLCALIGPAGGGGTYFFAFAVVLLGTAGLYAALAERKLRPAIPAVILITVMTISLGVNFSPTLHYLHERGSTGISRLRSPADVEIYGLRLTDLVFPTTAHRLPLLSEFKKTYSLDSPRPNEGTSDALGFLGAAGLLFLLGTGIFQRFPRRHEALLRASSTFCLALFFLATVGGLGEGLGYLLFPLLRSYNRVCVFLAFFAFLAVALAFDTLLSLAGEGRLRSWGTRLGVLALGTLGLLDQSSPSIVPDYGALSELWKNEKRFVAEIERHLAPEAMVFQLPFVAYPEWPAQNGTHQFDPGRFYLHSRRTRWSFGVTKGRSEFEWMAALSALPVPKLLPLLAERGFAGVEIDRYGYEPAMADQLRAELTRLTGNEPLRDSLGRYDFFFLKATVARPAPGVPVLLEWGHEFYPREQEGKRKWRWCSRPSGEIVLENHNPFSVTIRLSFLTSTVHPVGEPRLEATNGTSWLRFERKESIVRMLPPGRHHYRFVTSIAPWRVKGDDRMLTFAVHDLTLEELGPPGAAPPRV